MTVSDSKMNLKILEMMRFKPCGHNQVSLAHIECISEFFEEFCPIAEKKAKKMLRASSGISSRYVQEYIDGFEAWKIISIKGGMIEYLVGKDEKVNIANDKNESDYVVEHSAQDVILPCKYRNKLEDSTEFMPCNPEPGKVVIPNSKQCNECKQREE